MPAFDNKIVARIMSGELSRSECLGIRDNALRILKAPKTEEFRLQAEEVLRACDAYAPNQLSAHYNFMGFCPGADIKRRRDLMWKEKGICDFHFDESPAQLEKFAQQVPGDWIILKKRLSLKDQEMELFGFGKITRRREDDDGYVFFDMNWDKQSEVIVVPLMGCNATVNMRSLKQVEEAMSTDFWDWLGAPFESSSSSGSNREMVRSAID
jgi:hypothetical protein